MYIEKKISYAIKPSGNKRYQLVHAVANYTSRNGDNKRKHKKYFIEMICRKYQIF